ncbi:uncharacterized protein gpr156 [Polymixia lowei]
MASAGSLLSEEQFLCPICLDVFTQPVSTPCGHNFCRDCIQGYWQSAKLSQCPMCKQKFYRRPELKVNTFISEMAARFRRSVEMKDENERGSRAVDPASAQPSNQYGEVSCDVCHGKTVHALKSCLDCLASYCDTHLEPHLILGAFKKHRLIDPVMSMQDRVCEKHERLLELFCATDQTYVCQVCIRKDHKAHHSVPIETEYQGRRAQLGRMETEVQRMIQSRLGKVSEIRDSVQLGRRNAEREIEDSLQVFAALLRCIQKGQADVVEVIEGRQREAERKAEGLIKELELEIAELTRRSTELEQLSHTDDHLHFLKSFQSISTLPATKDWSETSLESVVYVGTVRRAARRAGSQLDETLKAEMGVELPKRSLSPVLVAVVWTLLSCGILLTFCFLLFTLRFKNNRIVKMSSPNLNVLTLMGSVLTYSSGFLFAIDEHTLSQGGASRAVLQARMWTLCVGSTLVFGPILGKTWRLYRVFTQRVPDKRVIIRDIQLMSMVGLLILVDMLVLTAWNLTDPIRCSRSVGAVVKVVEKDISYTLSQLDSCSSVYSDLWVILIAVLKGSLLLYGTYLAGLTSNVSHPPVNQSPTIITAVSLVTVSSAVAVPVSIFLQAWPNLAYSTVAGAIFICTLATNCLLFVPQLTQWRQFEEDHNNPSQMAKYFSSPSKSQPSVYSQDEIYYLLGENNSMKKLLNEKNAVIDSLQEQVNNAKDKLLRLMSASQSHEDGEVDSSATNLNSSSTQTTVVQSDCPSTPLPQRDAEYLLSSPSSPSPCPAAAAVSSTVPPFPEPPPAVPASSPLPGDSGGVLQAGPKDSEAGGSGSEEQGSQHHLPPQSSGVRGTGPGAAAKPAPGSPLHGVTSPHNLGGRSPAQAETTGCHGNLASQLGSGVRPGGFVSSEQLQEILQELSVDAALENALRSPNQVRTSRRPSQPNFTEKSFSPSPLSPTSLRSPRSPHAPVLFCYPSISPYAMRKRRPPFHSPRGGPPPCFYPGSEPPGWRKRRDNPGPQNLDKHPSKTPPQPEGAIVDTTLFHLDNSDIEEEEGEEEELVEGDIRRCRRCISRPRRRSVMRRARHSHAAPSDVEAGGEGGQYHRHSRDSCGYWDSDSSSSTDYCYYHRPYCDRSLLSSETSSDSSDSEYEAYTSLYRSPHPVVFKEDLKPTFV